MKFWNESRGKVDGEERKSGVGGMVVSFEEGFVCFKLNLKPSLLQCRKLRKEWLCLMKLQWLKLKNLHKNLRSSYDTETVLVKHNLKTC
jgi:hypothetical protein